MKGMDHWKHADEDTIGDRVVLWLCVCNLILVVVALAQGWL